MTSTLAPVSFRALGTTATVVVDDAGDGWTEAAVDAVRAEVAAIDLACSRFRPDSELSRLNAAGGRPVPASPLFLEAVEVALRAARLTGGLVDPTVGRALRLLGYDRDFATLSREDPGGNHVATLSREDPGGNHVATLVAGPVGGWRSVACDRLGRTIALPEGVELDLGATAKALAADRAAKAAARAAGRGILVSLGGDIAVAGSVPTGGWSVRVTDDHAAGPHAAGQTVAISGGGLATSGTTVRRWRHGGTEVHHLIDPTTGTPAGPTWRTVSVAAASCVDANTASTAAIVLGPAAAGWLSAQGLPARLVAAAGAVTYVAGWPRA